jgi:hypothetical protein
MKYLTFNSISNPEHKRVFDKTELYSNLNSYKVDFVFFDSFSLEYYNDSCFEHYFYCKRKMHKFPFLKIVLTALFVIHQYYPIPF